MSSVFQVSRGSWTMRLAGLALQEHLREQADHVVALDERALLVEEEAAIEVAVPGEPDVGPLGEDRVDGRRLRFSTIIGFGTPFGNVPSGA